MLSRSWRMSALVAFTLMPLVPTAGARAAEVAAAADTQQTLASGATFIQPVGWAVSGAPGARILAPPEGDFTITFVDVGSAPDAAAAVAAAWKTVDPGFKRPVELSVPAAARDGWDEIVSVRYETSPNEHKVVQALAQRKGSNWVVMLANGNQATLEKRGGSAATAFGSLRPAGFSRETFVGRSARPLDAARIEALKGFVQSSMQALDVAGVSIALMEKGKLVYSGGFGVKEVGKPDKVDADTLFMIASNSKGMSTLMLAKLVDEGRFKWTDKAVSIYPQFRLGSDATTAEVEMRHLVCACTGLPRRDFPDILNGSSLTTPASKTFVNLAATEPTSKFGETFQYNNLMASAAGYIGAHVAFPAMEIGAGYDRAMEEKVFKPLGMRDTTLDWAKAERGNHSAGHGADIDGKLALANTKINTAFFFERPAGGIWSSANDVIKYVDNELRQGTLPNGKPYIRAENVVARRLPNVPLGEDGFYGMGLMGQKVGGVQVYHHGGDLIGYHSDLIFVPDADVGAVILTNTDSGAALRSVFMRRLMEVLYDGKPEAEAQIAAAAGSIRANQAATRKQLTYPADPAVAAGLATRYVSEDLGTMTFTRTGGGLSGSNGVWSTPFATRVNPDGTTSLVTAGTGLIGIEFVVTNVGGKRGLTVRDGQHVYSYSEAP